MRVHGRVKPEDSGGVTTAAPTARVLIRSLHPDPRSLPRLDLPRRRLSAGELVMLEPILRLVVAVIMLAVLGWVLVDPRVLTRDDDGT